jgi:hypothetical protein
VLLKIHSVFLNDVFNLLIVLYASIAAVQEAIDQWHIEERERQKQGQHCDSSFTVPGKSILQPDALTDSNDSSSLISICCPPQDCHRRASLA